MSDDIHIRSQFAFLDDNSLQRLDAIANGSDPIDETAVRFLASAIAVNARLGRQLVSHIVRLNSVGSFVVK